MGCGSGTIQNNVSTDNKLQKAPLLDNKKLNQSTDKGKPTDKGGLGAPNAAVYTPIRIVFIVTPHDITYDDYLKKISQQFNVPRFNVKQIAYEKINEMGQAQTAEQIYQGRKSISTLLANQIYQQLMKRQFKGRLIIEGYPQIYEDYEAWKQVIAINARVEELIYLKFYQEDEEYLYHRSEEYLKNQALTNQQNTENEQIVFEKIQYYHNYVMQNIQLFEMNGELRVSPLNPEKEHTQEKRFEQFRFECIQGAFLDLEDQPDNSPNLLVFLGGKGSGKTTQIKQAVQQFQLQYINMQDLIEKEKKQKNNNRLLNNLNSNDQLLVKQSQVQIIKNYFIQNEWKGNFILEGFPNSIEQWDELYGALFFVILKGYIYLKSDKRVKLDPEYEAMVTRINDHYDGMTIIDADKDSKTVYKEVKQKIKMCWMDIEQFPHLNQRIVFVLGGPASGKKQMIQKLCKEYPNFNPIYRDDLVYEQVKDNGQYQDQIEKYQNEGESIPPTLFIQILRNQLKTKYNFQGNFLVENFPQNLEEWETWLKYMNDFMKPQLFVFLEIQQETALSRMLNYEKYDEIGPENYDQLIDLYIQQYDALSLNLEQDIDNASKLQTVKAQESEDDVFKQLKQVISRQYLDVRVMPNERPEAIFVVGIPGSGQSTLCNQLVDKFNVVHLNVRDLLKQESKLKGYEESQEIKKYLDAFEEPPMNLVLPVLQRAFRKYEWNKNFLIDGFPRFVQDEIEWYNVIDFRVNIPLWIYLDVPEDIARQRLVQKGEKPDNIDQRFQDNQYLVSMMLETKMASDFSNSIKKIDGSLPADKVFYECFKLINDKYFQVK